MPCSRSPGGGSAPRGCLLRGRECGGPPKQTAPVADGMHPTGMHSCFICLFERLLLPANEVWSKVIFLQASVCHSVHRVGLPHLPPPPPTHRQTPLPDADPHWMQSPMDADPPGCRPPPPAKRYTGYYGIRSTSGRYASYWNAFLF